MKYNVGDIVIADLNICNYSINHKILQYNNKAVTIAKKYSHGSYRIIEDDGKYFWNDTMFKQYHQIYYLYIKDNSIYQLNDVININGLNVIITKEFIKLNKNLFYICDKNIIGITEDKSPIIEGNAYHIIDSNFNIVKRTIDIDMINNKSIKIFNSFNNIKNEYSNIVLNIFESEYIDDNIKALKTKYPNLYWRCMLVTIRNKLIQYHWSPNINTDHYFILEETHKDGSSEIKIKKHASVVYDLIYFPSHELAVRAKEIMGNNIKWVV